MSHPAFAKTVDRLIERFAAADYYPTPLVDLTVMIAHADGSIDRSEIDMVRQVIDIALGASMRDSLVELLINVSVEVMQSAGVTGRLRTLAAILCDCGAEEDGVRFAALVAHGSKGLGPKERALIDELGALCKLPASTVERLANEAKKTIPSAALSGKSLT